MEETLNTPELQPEVVQNTPELQPQETPVEHKPTPQESFQELRQRAEQAERQRNEVIEYARQLEQYAMQQQNQQPVVKQSDPDPVSYDDDEIIEGRHLKAEFSSLKRELQEQKRIAEESRRIAENNAIENKLRSKYNDFDSVVTYENIQKLRQLKPEVAASLHQSQDLYSKAAATYTILKDLGISQPTHNYSDDHLRAQNNINKPKASPTLSAPSALSHASDFAGGNLTEDRKRQIYDQMLQNARRR